MSERESFWKQVIIGKFGEDERGWCALEARKRYGVGLWKAIRKGWGAFKRKLMRRNVEESNADGHEVRLGRLQDSNAVLSHFNEYSEHCYAEVSNDFSRNTRLLKSMKTDLDYIFQKLRYLIVF
ncbi:hypothetical protein CK203_092059 [Vitis vinifera]|uniref:KxDL domain-containing protein n=1 Tax=Vitis vinifera TaxID=29760 RepID=A0A438CLA4_VITVI|nr:hypothetical protein CK203_092059 [Vitis vinifera]